MATTTPSAALIPVALVFTNTERLALAGFLAGVLALAVLLQLGDFGKHADTAAGWLWFCGIAALSGLLAKAQWAERRYFLKLDEAANGPPSDACRHEIPNWPTAGRSGTA